MMIQESSTENNIHASNLRLLINEINNHQGEWSRDVGGEEIEPGIIQMPYVITGPLPMRAMNFLYVHDLLVDFDWFGWIKGKGFFKDRDPSKYNKLEKERVLKLLTTVARNDRFCEGAWSQFFESGDVQILFRRLFEIEKSQK